MRHHAEAAYGLEEHRQRVARAGAFLEAHPTQPAAQPEAEPVPTRRGQKRKAAG